MLGWSITPFVSLSLVLFMDAISMSGSDLTVNVRAFGATGNPGSPQTNSIHKAIRACSKSGGGTVFFPAGSYLTGAIQLESNVVLRLDSGAVIKGSSNLDDYYLNGKMVGLILASDAENVGIVGYGAIDGSAASFMDMNRRSGVDGPVRPLKRPGNMVVFSGCRNFVVQDVTLRNSPFWTLHLAGCDNGDVINVNINNDMLIPNNDGIHCTTSRNIRISNCYIQTGDDGIAVTGIIDHARIIPGFVAHEGKSENIVVTNCTLSSRSAAVRVGYGDNDVQNCVFSNLVVYGSNRGLGVFVRGKGSVSNILFSNIVIDTRLHSIAWWGNAEPIHLSAAPISGQTSMGQIRNVHFSNILARSETGVIIHGSTESLVRDVEFDQIKLQIVRSPFKERSGNYFDLRPAKDDASGWFEHKLPALYCRFAKGIEIHQMKLEWPEDLPDYFEDGLQFEDFEDLEIEGFCGRQAQTAGSGAAIVLQGGSKVTIRDSRAPEQTGTFLKHSGLTGSLLFMSNDVQHAQKVFQPDQGGFRLTGNPGRD